MLDSLKYPQAEPKREDLAGIYLPTAPTLKDIRERGHYAERGMSIELSADGAFVCTNIPDWWTTDFGKPAGGFITKTGSWKPIRQQEQWWAIGLDFSSPGNFNSPNTSIALIGAKPPYTLRLILGDPDQGQAMDFAKRD